MLATDFCDVTAENSLEVNLSAFFLMIWPNHRYYISSPLAQRINTYQRVGSVIHPSTLISLQFLKLKSHSQLTCIYPFWKWQKGFSLGPFSQWDKLKWELTFWIICWPFVMRWPLEKTTWLPLPPTPPHPAPPHRLLILLGGGGVHTCVCGVTVGISQRTGMLGSDPTLPLQAAGPLKTTIYL